MDSFILFYVLEIDQNLNNFRTSVFIECISIS